MRSWALKREFSLKTKKREDAQMLKYLSQVGQARRGLGHRHPMTERDVIKYEKAVRKGQEMTDEEARKKRQERVRFWALMRRGY